MEDRAAKVSVEEYLVLDRDAERKLEYLNGTVVAMAGASPRHNQLVANIFGRLLGELRGGPCRVFSQDQRVCVEATRSFTYPDVVVVCEEARFDTSARPASLVNPSAVVEVLSESTRDHDLGAKLGHYRRIPAICEVLLVQVEERTVTLVTREEDGSWRLVDRGPEGAVEVAGVPLSLDVIYERAESLPA